MKFHLLLLQDRLHFRMFFSHDLQQILRQCLRTLYLLLIWATVSLLLATYHR